MKKLSLTLILFILSFSTMLLGCSNLESSSVEIINNSQTQSSSDNNSSSNNKPNHSNDTSRNKTNEKSNDKKVNSITENLLKSIKDKSLIGQVIDYDFTLGDSIYTVTSKLGDSSSEDYVAEAKGNYFNFNDYHLSFGCNKGDQIFEIRSLNENLKNLNLNDVENFFGKPDYDITTKSKEKIIGYKMTKDFKILFVFNTTTYKLNHYSVLYPSITQNSMAGDSGREW